MQFGTARTGIDLGSHSLKLIRGDGSPGLQKLTHAGVERTGPGEPDAAGTASALKRVLDRLGLKRNQLGRIAVAVRAEEGGIREAVMPELSEAELRRALPYEARRFLSLEEMEGPIVDFQILGPERGSEPDSAKQMRVLFAGVSAKARDFPLEVLKRVGLEPEVITMEPLAGLAALQATAMDREEPSPAAFGLLDLGARQTQLYITQSQGRVLVRALGPGVPDDPGGVSGYVAQLNRNIRETADFYRARHHVDLSTLYLCGGGAMDSGLVDQLHSSSRLAVEVLDPLVNLRLSQSVGLAIGSSAPCFVTALGLCRWWDA